jgi:hypothetical protein
MSSFEFRTLTADDGSYGKAHRPARRGPRRRSPKLIPRLDALEARTVPSTLWVTSNQDGAPGSLRAELGVASAGDTIEFAPSAYGTTTLTEGPLEVNTSVDIQGPGAKKVTISGNQKSTVFDIPGGVTATISGLTVADGAYDVPYGYGAGGINNDGTLTLSNDVVTGNSTGAGTYGVAGILTDGPLTIAGCTISGNTSAESVGGVLNQTDGPLTITGSTISGNTGHYSAGIYFEAPVSITDSSISDNDCPTCNGGGGAMAGFASMTLTGSVVSGNVGGGISISTDYGSPVATLKVTNSQIVHNTINEGTSEEAFGAGIDDSGSPVIITGSNISDNVVEGFIATGAAIYLGYSYPIIGSLTISDSTFQDNQSIATGPYANGLGGAISINYASSFSVSDSAFIGNSMTAADNYVYGGAIYDAGCPASTITGTLFLGNTVATTSYGGAYGGAIDWSGAYFQSNSVLTISGCAFLSNLAQGGPTASGLGGAIFAEAYDGTLNLSSSTFVDNSAVGGAAATTGSDNTGGDAYGGALVSAYVHTTVSHSAFLDNTAVGGSATGDGNQAGSAVGGAIQNIGFYLLNVSDSTLIGNSAVGGAGIAGATGGDGQGGAIAENYGPLQVNQSSILDNSAIGGSGGGDGEGGGVFISGTSAHAAFTSALISLNQASGGSGGGKGYGGGLYIGTGAITVLTNTKVLGNVASTAGDNIYGPYTIG